MELHHLRYFVAVADALSFRRAAEQVRVAQPAVTRAVQQLEAEVGAPLLRRDRAGVALTKAGSLVLERARGVLDAVERLGQGITSEAVVTLRVGHVLPEYFRAGPMAARVREYLTRQPTVALDVQPMLHKRMLRALAAGQLDAGFAWLPVEGITRNVSVDVVMLDTPVVALPRRHRLAGSLPIALSKLRGETFLLFPRAAMPERYDEIMAMLRRSGFDPRVSTLAPSLRDVLLAVADGGGVSIVPRIAATVHRRAAFSLHEIEGVSARWSLGVLAPRAARGSALKSFLAAVRRESPVGN